MSKQITITEAAKLLLIAVKQGKIVIYPQSDTTADYIQILENAINNSSKG